MSLALLWAVPSFGARTLAEYFEIYSSPQALSMGNAMTADAIGFMANYYNPAGLAKMRKRKTEVHVMDLNFFGSENGAVGVYNSSGFGLSGSLSHLQSNPNTYGYWRFNALSAISLRGLSLALLYSQEFAGRSDGTDVDVFGHTDIGATFGIARNFAGNLIKVGVSGKAILRNELNGNFAHSALSSDTAINSNMSEGYAFGADAGVIITLPFAGLPTLGIVYKDILNTTFSQARLLNPLSSSAPETIPQSLNAAISIHPAFSHDWRTTLVVELKHLEDTSMRLPKRFHVGLQVANSRRSYFWVGLNQLHITGGLALRLPGGFLEMGTYGVDVGQNQTLVENRRYYLRYTVSF